MYNIQKHFCLVTMAKRSHLFPCRTQKLSSLALMVVGLTFRESRTLPSRNKRIIGCDERRTSRKVRNHILGCIFICSQSMGAVINSALRKRIVSMHGSFQPFRIVFMSLKSTIISTIVSDLTYNGSSFFMVG